MITETLLDEVKRKCYITDNSDLTDKKVKDMIKTSLVKVRRMLGVSKDFDFEEEGNEEELELFKNYCWYDWNDSSNEFKINYLEEINSLHSKHEVEQYEEEI